MSDLAPTIRERYDHVLGTIAGAARKARRPPESVRLVVVTKLQPVSVIRAAIVSAVARNAEYG
ncbi:MAG: hypothetical protein ACK2T0_06320, partial [Anaerolineales bacterium]